MKEKIKGIIIGLVIGLSVVAITVSAYTAVQKELHYNDIKILLDDEEIKPIGSDGSYVEPFIIEGVTYLPVRGIANALNLDVEWEQETQTVKLYTYYRDENVVFAQDGIKITYKNFEHDEWGELTVNFLIENNSTKNILVSINDTSINGFMVDGYMYEQILAGKKANASIEFYSFSLEDDEISNIEEIEFSFHIYNHDTYKTICNTDIIKITPSGVSVSK